MDLESVATLTERMRAEVGKAVVGADDSVTWLIVALISGGHILLEGPPGVAKTLLARAFARALRLHYGRIQFTPDLMPGDVIGTNLFDFRTSSFALTKGPIFTQLLLADEINRTAPKTQAALLEAMQERSVTIDGTSHDLGEGFMVIATQNPIEQLGTYPLPEAQLDRFLFKLVIDYPDAENEYRIVADTGRDTRDPLDLITPVADLDMLRGLRDSVTRVTASEPILRYVVEIVRATRQHPALQYGASPRAAAMLALAARAHAAVSGRDYVIPDDIKALSIPVLRHRIIMTPGAELDDIDGDSIIGQIVEQTAAPR